MRAWLSGVFFLLPLAAQPRLAIDPPTAVNCNVQSLARVTVTWDSGGAQPVQILTGGQPLTGLEGPRGFAATGEWVSNGMVFTLVDQRGTELARAIAVVSCQRPDAIVPLAIGNEWTYIANSRAVTGALFTRRVTGTEIRNGVIWFLIETVGGTEIARWRVDEENRLLALTDRGEQFILDPSTITAIDVAVDLGPFGRYANGVRYSFIQGLRSEQGFYVPGLGLVTYSASMLTGSSGGFTDGASLLRARIGGKVLSYPEQSIELAIEPALLDLTNRRAPNCAIPCYFAACFLAGADPPGTYKPCLHAHARVPASETATLILELLGPGGDALFRRELQRPTSFSVSLPLYSRPNEIYPPGTYTLRARLMESGREIASAQRLLDLR